MKGHSILFLLFTFSFSLLNAQEFPDSLMQDIFDQKEVDYYEDHPVRFDSQQPNNLHYRVKVGSFSQNVDPSFFQKFYPVTASSNDKANRYFVGLFTHYQNAELARSYLVESGFNGAFLVAFYRGKEISLSKAIEKEQSFYTLGTKTVGNTSNVRVVMTPIEQKEKTPVLDSTKLSDNQYYLDYFFYEFENVIRLDSINSEGEEIMPIVWAGNQQMSFVRAFYEDNVGGIKTGHDAWMAKKNEKGEFKLSGAFETINTKSSNAIIGVSKDGQRAYLFNNEEGKDVKRGVSMIENNNGIWSSPREVTIPELHFTGNYYGLYMHPDEDLLLISMNAKDSYGENDIYVCEKDEFGHWGTIIHLDTTINTDGNDISPFLSEDKRLFLYSTNGMGGVGGNDLLVFKKMDSTWTNWSEPRNLGPEVNTSTFQGYPFISGDKLYFSSVADSGLSDIYQSDIVSRMFLPIQDYLEMEDTLLFTYNVEAGILSDENDENFAFENIPVRSMVNTDSRIDMIFFDYDRYNLKPSFTQFLNQLYQVLKDNPDINLDLRGHTDSIGSLAYNYVLGENRALSVKDYLISIGISPNRIEVSSYGKEIPIASNETAYGRAKNRRVEIRFSNE